MTRLLPLISLALLLQLSPALADGERFKAKEQTQVSVGTPGLFDRSDAFAIDFSVYGARDYSFPLTGGKAFIVRKGGSLQISTRNGDAVRAAFDGVVRLAYKHPRAGNIIVIRHANGLETVYGDNSMNLVMTGDSVKAGQPVAIIGGVGRATYCTFSVMVDGRRIDPATVIDMDSHRLRNITLKVWKEGTTVRVIPISHDGGNGLMVYTGVDVFASVPSVRLDLSRIDSVHWAYPLPGAKVLSPYGDHRRHAGVDFKTTKQNDKILAAFGGVVTRSGWFAGYGNCIDIVHANGLKTRYGHQSKNLVKVGNRVKAGQVIGLVGRTGHATTEHLHFEIFCQNRRHDPARIFDYANHKLKDITVELTKDGEINLLTDN